MMIGVAAVVMERVAYRPLRRRNAPRLTALITAIGIAIFVQEFLGLRYGRYVAGEPRNANDMVLAQIKDPRERAAVGGWDTAGSVSGLMGTGE